MIYSSDYQKNNARREHMIWKMEVTDYEVFIWQQ